MDIYEFAMEMEMEGRYHYLKMAEDSTEYSEKTIFTILAEEELRHYQYLSKMANKSWFKVKSDRVEVAEKAFTTMLGTESFSGHLLPIDLYAQGIQLEEQSMDFYRKKVMTEGDPAARMLFLKLYFEEKKHKLLLENILEVILEPEMHLESSELFLQYNLGLTRSQAIPRF